MSRKLKNNYKITCIVGSPGSGKSATAQYLILKNLKEGKKVWSNMSFYGAMKLDLNDLGKVNFTEKDEEGVFIIDEAGISFNSRQWDKLSTDIIEFLKYHRHYRLDIYFFSQGDDMDKSIRTLSQQWYKVIKLPIPFFKFSALIPVDVSLDIIDGQWKLAYKQDSFFLGWWFIPIYKSFKYYDSYSRPNLPEKDFKFWEVQVKEKNKNKIQILFDKFCYFLKNAKNKKPQM